jgi:hypothetical protein
MTSGTSPAWALYHHLPTHIGGSKPSVPKYEWFAQLSRVPSERVNFLYPDITKDHRGFVGIESEVNAGE